MVTDHYTQLGTQVRATLLTTVEPIERAASAPKEAYNWITQDFSTLNQISADKKRLETENLLLKSQLHELNKSKIEIIRLNRLLGTASQQTLRTSKIASVIAYSDSLFANFVTIDKGLVDGITSLQPVIDADGIIGKTTVITPFKSRVLLIIDTDSQIPVRIRRTGQRGILAGQGSDILALKFIPSSSSIRIGDIIEASGLGGLFTSGYPVAIVSNVKHLNDQPYFEVTAHPSAKIHTSNKVLILQKQTEQAPNE